MTTVTNVSEAPTLGGEEHYEIVNGIRVELPPMGAYQSVLASFILEILGPFVRSRNLGRVVVEALFQLDRKGNLQRRPDVAFVSYQRWAENRDVPDTRAWNVIPELAIEVNSPSNTANEILHKIRDYFRSGVECVWVVYPATEQVYVYTSAAKNVILEKSEYLEAAGIMSGFRYSIADLFEMRHLQTSAKRGARRKSNPKGGRSQS